MRRREAIDGGVDDDAGSTWNQLSQARTERSQAANRVERLEQSIERTEARLVDRCDELDGLEVADNDSKSELVSAREHLKQVKRDKEVLQSLYSTNERVLTENRLDLVTDVERELSGDTVACWTCSEETTREDVADSLDELGTRITELRAETERHRDRVEQLEARREEITQTKRRKQDLEREVADLEEKLAD